MKNTFKLIQVLDNLSRIPRSGGVLFAGINPERGDSLAEHAYKVVWLVLLFSGKVRAEGHDVDELTLLKIAITHDWSEAVLLDIPSGAPSYKDFFKDVDIREVVRKAEDQVNKEIEELVSDEIDLDVMNLELPEKDRAILKAADLTAVLLEILEWRYSGLKHEWFNYIWSNTYRRLGELIEENLPEINPLLEELESAYESGEKPPNPFLTKSEFQSYKK